MTRLLASLCGLMVLAFTSSAWALAPIASAAPSGSVQVGVTSVNPNAPASASKEARADVKVRDTLVITLRAGKGEKSAFDRAHAANQTIDTLLETNEDVGEVRLDESTSGAAVIFAGKTPVLTLTDDDAAAAGEPSLHVLAANATQKLEEGMRTEQKRSRIAQTVFSLSLLVFSGLIAFLIVGRVGEGASKVRVWMKEHPEKISGLRVGNIEVLGVAAVRGAISVALTLLHRLSQVAIAYGWLIFSLSLFESTRAYTERLGGFVIAPVSALVSRVGSALPMLVIVAVASAVVFVLIRFVGLFMESVTRGETRVAWMPSDFAKPVSLLLRGGIIVAALLVATPLITGSDDGAFSRAGMAALFALGVAATPVLASVAAGVIVVFGRRLRRGEYVELGARAGRVLGVSLLEVRLLEREGSELRVPHLLSLFQPTRVIGKLPLTVAECVMTCAPEKHARRAIEEATRALGGKVRIQLLSIDDTKAHYRVTAEEPSSGALEGALRRALHDVAQDIFPGPRDPSAPIIISPASIPPPSAIGSVPPPPVVPIIDEQGKKP